MSSTRWNRSSKYRRQLLLVYSNTSYSRRPSNSSSSSSTYGSCSSSRSSSSRNSILLLHSTFTGRTHQNEYNDDSFRPTVRATRASVIDSGAGTSQIHFQSTIFARASFTRRRGLREKSRSIGEHVCRTSETAVTGNPAISHHEHRRQISTGYDMNTSTLVWFALCCCSSLAVPVPDRRLRQTDRVVVTEAAADTDQPFDPSLDALADAKYDEGDATTDDREKRQLSFVQGKLLNFLKVRALASQYYYRYYYYYYTNRSVMGPYYCDLSFDRTRVIYPIPRWDVPIL